MQVYVSAPMILIVYERLFVEEIVSMHADKVSEATSA